MSEVTSCPECGSDSIEHDSEDEEMWHCMNCGHRFPKDVVPDNFKLPDPWLEGETEEDEDDFLTEGEEEEWGF